MVVESSSHFNVSPLLCMLSHQGRGFLDKLPLHELLVELDITADALEILPCQSQREIVGTKIRLQPRISTVIPSNLKYVQ